jgi:hypothetical protein
MALTLLLSFSRPSEIAKDSPERGNLFLIVKQEGSPLLDWRKIFLCRIPETERALEVNNTNYAGHIGLHRGVALGF